MVDLCKLRAAQGLSQQQLADRVGCIRQTVSHIETGRIIPSVPMAQAIAQVLGFDWTEFYTGGNDMNKDQLYREFMQQDIDDDYTPLRTLGRIMDSKITAGTISELDITEFEEAAVMYGFYAGLKAAERG